MGAPDPWEKEKDGSGPTLERGLPCCDVGRSDSLLIQEPCDENDSREVSEAATASLGRMNECRLLVFGGVTCMPAVGGRGVTLTGFEASGEGCGSSGQ